MPFVRAVAAFAAIALCATAALAGDDAAPGNPAPKDPAPADPAPAGPAPKDPAPADAAPAGPAQIAESLKAKDAALRLKAAQEAKNLQDDKLLAPLAALLDDPDAGIRRAAIDALACRVPVEAQKKASAALAAHLPKVSKKLETQLEQIATAEALGTLAQPAALDALISGIETDSPPDVAEARLAAAANIPTAEAIEALIQFLAKQGRGQNGPQREACRRALRAATGENLGNDPDTWRAWWRDAKKTFDFDAAVRRRAAEKQKKDDAGKRRADKKGRKNGEGDGRDGKKDDDGKK